MLATDPRVLRAALVVGVAVLVSGCTPGRTADRGLPLVVRLTAAGKPVAVAPGEEVTISLMSSAGKRHILFQQDDGTFVWPRPDIDGPALTPGSYRVSVARSGRPSQSAAPPAVKDRLAVEEGKLDYTIDVGRW